MNTAALARREGGSHLVLGHHALLLHNARHVPGNVKGLQSLLTLYELRNFLVISPPMSGKVAGSLLDGCLLVGQAGWLRVCEHAAVIATLGQEHTISFIEEADCIKRKNFGVLRRIYRVSQKGFAFPCFDFCTVQ